MSEKAVLPALLFSLYTARIHLVYEVAQLPDIFLVMAGKQYGSSFFF